MNYKNDPRYNSSRFGGPANDGVAFANVDDKDVALNTNGRDTDGRYQKRSTAHITCHKCGLKGQYATTCTTVVEKVEKKAEATLVTAGELTEMDFEDQDHVHFQFLMTRTTKNYRSVLFNHPTGTVPKA